MPVQIFTGNIIAVIWDFDKTLIPGYQQDPLFAHYGIDAKEFWDEVNGLVSFYNKHDIKVSTDTIYLNHILTYVSQGYFGDLTNSRLRQFGQELEFYDGMPEFMGRVDDAIAANPRFAAHDIAVEHYIVSTGLRQIMLGSKAASRTYGIWGCEFIEQPAGRGYLQEGQQPSLDQSTITQVGYFLDNTTKTRAVWEINKGTNVDPNIDVNARIAPEDRRVPIRNMLYVADGPSDIPIFSILDQFGGRRLGVYNPEQESHFLEAKRLQDQGRVDHFVEADYSEGTPASRWIFATLEEIGEKIVRDRERALTDRVHRGAHHVT